MYFCILGSSTVTRVFQILSIVSSLLSLCSGYTSWKKLVEEEEFYKNWTFIDTALDFTWNVLGVSARVVTLALFASYQLNWFWGIISAQILVATSLGCYFAEDSSTRLFSGIVSLFTLAPGFPPRAFIVYGVLIFIENTIMISLWYALGSGGDTWYHDVAISCVIVGYALSWVIKAIHEYSRNEDEFRDCWA